MTRIKLILPDWSLFFSENLKLKIWQFENLKLKIRRGWWWGLNWFCQIDPSWQFETLKIWDFQDNKMLHITKVATSFHKGKIILFWLCFDILSDPKSSVWTYIGPIYHFIRSQKRKTEKKFSLHQFQMRRGGKSFEKGKRDRKRKGGKGQKGSWWWQL